MPKYDYCKFKFEICSDNIELEKLTRIYNISLDEKPFDVVFSLPLYFRVSDFIDKSNSWKDLVDNFVIYLFNAFPEKRNILYEYIPEWSNYHAYVNEQSPELRKVCDGLYAFNSFSAMHSIWLIVDLIKKYDLKGQKILKIKRYPGSESTKVAAITIKFMEESFFKYLRFIGKSELNAKTLLANMSKINKIQSTVSNSFTNFYLIDDQATLSRIKMEFFKKSFKSVFWSSKQLEIVRKTLDYYTDFFKDLNKLFSNN